MTRRIRNETKMQNIMEDMNGPRQSLSSIQDISFLTTLIFILIYVIFLFIYLLYFFFIFIIYLDSFSLSNLELIFLNREYRRKLIYIATCNI